MNIRVLVGGNTDTYLLENLSPMSFFIPTNVTLREAMMINEVWMVMSRAKSLPDIIPCVNLGNGEVVQFQGDNPVQWIYHTLELSSLQNVVNSR